MSTHMLLIRGMPTGAYIDIGELRAALAPQRAVHEYILLGVEFPPAGVGGPAVKRPLVGPARGAPAGVYDVQVVPIAAMEHDGWEFVQFLPSARFDGSGVRALFRRPLTYPAQEGERP